ncbi:MAG: TlpA disulfide reductase family protein [Mucilaginibacter sp.]|uniref:TlpA family protein disulfide reductase n=1 Tax=Mucilaginibacter sp. TaxID=1882438 RepID=UPI0032663283
MQKTLLTIVMAALCLNFSAHAQETTPNITALKIGDQVPDIIINNIINYKGLNGKCATTAKISDFKDKLLILDFWATWCGSCIKNFPEVDSLQRTFSTNVQFLLVNTKSTGDKKEKIERLFNDASRFDGKVINIPCIILDTLFDQLFIHQMIPHYAWIYKGKVVAITSAEEVTNANIRSALQNDTLNLKVKQDVLNFDPVKPLFVNGNGGSENIIYRSQISGEISGLAGINNIAKDKTGGITLYRKINTSKLHLYKLAYNATAINNNRIFIDRDTMNVVQKGIKDPYIFCYELISPPISMVRVRERLQFDLKEYFNLTAKLETKVLRCLIIRKDGGKIRDNKIVASSKNEVKNGLIPYKQILLPDLINQLNNALPVPVLAESDDPIPLNLNLPADLSNVSLLANALKKQGFTLITENRPVQVLILKPAI